MNTNAAILIYGPDCHSTHSLLESFQEKNVEVKLFSEVENAYHYYCNTRPLVCILHEFSSLESCFPLARRILEFSRDTYLIFIFKQDKMINLRIGFQLGADDCLMIPYDTDELKLRIKAMIRRGFEAKAKPSEYVLGKYLFDAQKDILFFDKLKIHLTTRETDLLSLLCKKINQVVSWEDALNAIWSVDDFANSRVLSIYIYKLRQILKKDPSVQIVTQHGIGYKLTVNSANKITETMPYLYSRV